MSKLELLNVEQKRAMDLLASLLVHLEAGAGLQAPQNGPIVELRHALGIRSVYNSEQVWQRALLSMFTGVDFAQVVKRTPTDSQLDVIYNVGQALASANDLVGLRVGPQMLDTAVRALRARFNLLFDGHRPSSLEWAAKLLESLDFADDDATQSNADKMTDPR